MSLAETRACVVTVSMEPRFARPPEGEVRVAVLGPLGAAPIALAGALDFPAAASAGWCGHARDAVQPDGGRPGVRRGIARGPAGRSRLPVAAPRVRLRLPTGPRAHPPRRR